MCGIVGAAGDLSSQFSNKVFRNFLDVCQVRGRDSTGVIRINQALEYDWVKQIGTPYNLYDSSTWDKRVTNGLSAALIGHCRAKTVGDVSRRNAHPFDFPEQGICGVHNGTLRNVYKLDTYHHSKVDSEVLYGHLAENGPEETFSTLEGAWACVWWNDKEKSINFIRNNQRPLWFTWSKDMRMLFWASEPWMFGAVSRDIELWDGGEAKVKYFELPLDTLWSFKINPHAKKDENVLTMRPIKKIEPKPVTVTTHHVGGWQGGNGSYSRSAVTTPVAKKEESKGGEVTSPFQQPNKKPLVLLDDSLADLSPDSTSQEESGSTISSSVSFLRNSINSTESLKPQLPTLRSSKGTLSLPGATSKTSRQKSNVVHSDRFGGSATCSEKGTSKSKKEVSIREILGTRYITNNKTGTEITEQTFSKATNCTCKFCKTPVDLEEVGSIIDGQWNFVCMNCLTEPVTVPFVVAK